MKALFQSIALLSIGVATAAVSASPAAPASPYYGRWTVSQKQPVITAKGRQYQTIDIAPCGKDFCGISVADKGLCGPVLFRFLTKHADGKSELRGHAKWGGAVKNIQINTWEVDPKEYPGGRNFDLYVGDGYDFGERSENMPKFHGDYRRIGNARCTAR